ncbi:MAG: peptidase and in kexin sedolisin, partial [Phycisphaerales bacterium]|nr:peptidase and in kexin sedolisin [Phycisphaerales bacterium]
TGSITGYLWNDSNGDGQFNGSDSYTGVRVVFLDTNGNGKLDTGEKQTNSDAAGNYRFDGLLAGTYNVARVFPSGYRLSNGVNGKLTVVLASGQNASGVNMGTTSLAAPTVPVTPPVVVPPVVVPPVVVPPVVVPPVVVPPVVIPPVVIPPVVVPPVVVPPVTPPVVPAGTAAISGKVFPQSSKWNTLAAAASWTVFLDTNKNGLLDAGEVFTAAKSDLTYAFSNLAAGTYTVALKPPTGWNIVTPTTKAFTITVKAAAVKTGQNFVVTKA